MVTPLNALTHSLSIMYPCLWAAHQKALPVEHWYLPSSATPKSYPPSFSWFKSLADAPGGWDFFPSTGVIVTAQTAKLPLKHFPNHYSSPTDCLVTKHKPELSIWLVIDIICTRPCSRTGLTWPKKASLRDKHCTVFKIRREPDVSMKILCRLFFFSFKNIFQL